LLYYLPILSLTVALALPLTLPLSHFPSHTSPLTLPLSHFLLGDAGASEYMTFQLVASREFEFPSGFPESARDVVDRLLQLEPEQRLGGCSGDVKAGGNTG
jgi:hypothetical protein